MFMATYADLTRTKELLSTAIEMSPPGEDIIWTRSAGFPEREVRA